LTWLFTNKHIAAYVFDVIYFMLSVST